MPDYDVYVSCDKCGQPHSVNVRVSLDDEDLDKTSLGDYYVGRNVPGEVAFMQTNRYRCPHTKQLYPASDLADAVFFASHGS
jgi:hypothetical protein